mmetsp:Transcript_8778/g.25533  ORF Transcript_8778/g.25533 Transcript_8778/m.25533 type:complete len:141 (-) Transcript_8778:142-564(-)
MPMPSNADHSASASARPGRSQEQAMDLYALLGRVPPPGSGGGQEHAVHGYLPRYFAEPTLAPREESVPQLYNDTEHVDSVWRMLEAETFRGVMGPTATDTLSTQGAYGNECEAWDGATREEEQAELLHRAVLQQLHHAAE